MKTIFLTCLTLSLAATSFPGNRTSFQGATLDELTEKIFFRSTSLKHLKGQVDTSVPSAADVFLDTFMNTSLINSKSKVNPLIRYFQAHKPVNPRFLEHPLLLLLVKTIYASTDDSCLLPYERMAIFLALFKEEVFRCHPSKVDEGTKYLLGHYFGRRVLAMVGPVLEKSHLAWLEEVDPDLLALNHELLSSVKDFSWMSPGLIERAARCRFDFSTSFHAMKTMTAEGVFTFLQVRDFQLTQKQAQSIANLTKNFKEMLIVYPAALQSFMNLNNLSRAFGNISDVYYQVLAPVFVKTGGTLDMEVRNAFVAYYQLTEDVIDYFMHNLAFGVPESNCLEALKQIFLMRRTMLSDCVAAREEELAALFKVTLSYHIAAALNEFGVKAYKFAELQYERPKNQTEVISVYRQILEYIGADLIPYSFNIPFLTSEELLDLWLTALKKHQNNSYQQFNWNKQFIFALLAEQIRLEVDDLLEGALGHQFLDELLQMPSKLFNAQDLAFLEQLPENFQVLKLKYSTPIATLVDLQSFEFSLKFWLQQRSKMIPLLLSFNSAAFLLLSKIEASIESMLKSILAEMTTYDFIETVQSNPVFVAALNEVPQVLNSRLIKSLVSSEEGLAFLKANPSILYNLTSYGDFNLFLFVDSSAFDRFDLESVGIGLNTFSVVILNYLLDMKSWRLEEPAAFMWRLKPSLLAHTHLKGLALNNLSAQVWALSPVEAKRLNWHLNGVDLIGNVGQPTLTDLFNWHLTSELRFLEILINGSIPVTKFASIFAAEASSAVLIDEFLKRKLQSATTPKEASFLSRVRMILSSPLSDARASVILSVNNFRTAPERYIAPFRPLQPKFGSIFDAFITSVKRTSHVAKKLAKTRQNFLALAIEFRIVDSLMREQVELLGLLSLSLESFNQDEIGVEKKLHSLMTGELPMWQKRIVAKLGDKMCSSIPAFDHEPEEIQ